MMISKDHLNKSNDLSYAQVEIERQHFINNLEGGAYLNLLTQTGIAKSMAKFITNSR